MALTDAEKQVLAEEIQERLRPLEGLALAQAVIWIREASEEDLKATILAFAQDKRSQIGETIAGLEAQRKQLADRDAFYQQTCLDAGGTAEEQLPP